MNLRPGHFGKEPWRSTHRLRAPSASRNCLAEQFAATNDLTDPPVDGQVGVRELLARLGNLADAGYFSPANPKDNEEK